MPRHSGSDQGGSCLLPGSSPRRMSDSHVLLPPVISQPKGRRGGGGEEGGGERRRKGEEVGSGREEGKKRGEKGKGKRGKRKNEVTISFIKQSHLTCCFLEHREKLASRVASKIFALLYTHITAPLSSGRGARYSSWLLHPQFIPTLVIMCRGRGAGGERGGGLDALFSPWITVRRGQKGEGR